jgi:uncharacterized membrane protein HdeD (DUF308 family)
MTTNEVSGTGVVWPADARGPEDDEADLPSFGVLLGLGILTACFGLVLLIWPDVTVRIYAWLTGLWLMIVGLTRIIEAFRHRFGAGRRVFSGIVGVVLFIGGAACVRDVAKGVAVLALIISVSWLLSGVAWLVVGIRRTGSERLWMIILGVLSMLLGLGFLVWPEASLGILVWLTGLGSLALGIGEILFALMWRRRTAAARRDLAGAR